MTSATSARRPAGMRRPLALMGAIGLAAGAALLALVVAPGATAERARARVVDLLQVRGRWLGVMRIGFDPMPAYVPLPPQPNRRSARGPLRPHVRNPRYFADDHGDVVYLTGSHTWTNLQDADDRDPPAPFDFERFLDVLEGHHHNFFRLWRWENAAWGSWNNMPGFRIGPHPWLRTGPGTAADGRPMFDIERFDEAYFERLRARVRRAGERGFYVSVMLFQGWSIDDKGQTWGINPFRGHPFNPANNVNGVNGDGNGDGQGSEMHTLEMPRVVELQERYVRRVVDAVNDLDNVLYEIANESGPEAVAWQYHMVGVVKAYEATKAKQHPVGMTGLYPWPQNSLVAANQALYEGPADWISPAGDLHDRPPASGQKVIVADTDHLCGICGDREWVWKSFTSGENPLFMDVWNCAPWWYPQDCSRPEWPDVRRSLGYASDIAARVDLGRMVPMPDLASSRYALVSADRRSFVIYLPRPGTVQIDLTGAPERLRGEWLHPATGHVTSPGPVSGGSRQTLPSPFDSDAVLVIYAPQ